MSQVTDQQIADAQSYPPADTTLWDPALSWASQRAPGDTLDNGGCPPGYATIYGTSGRFCRYVPTATAQVIAQDTAPGFLDQSTINVAAAAQAIAGGAGTVVQATGQGIGWILSQASQTIATALGPLAPWLVAGGLFYVWMVGGFTAGREATAVARSRIRSYHKRTRSRR
jgi:hypothetical protein